jgi:general secretion pathway protein A
VYEAFYGFTEKPFNLTPDPKYLFLSPRHTEAFAHLEFGRRERGGFSVITGEVGTGKTTLARYFLSRLEPARTATAVILYPAVTAAELLRSILEDLHIPVTGTTLKDHVDALHKFLLAARREGRDVVLLIDEAQDLAPDVLEQIRLISNLETDTEKLIHIVLMGQSELHDMLRRHDLRQLAQRVTARYHLSPLSRDEVSEYIRHRLVVAGGDGKVTFTPAALRSVHRLSRGVPRLVNLICDRSLLGGYVNGTHAIDVAIVKRAAKEVRGESGLSRPRAIRYALVAGVVAGVVAAAVGLPVLRSASLPGTSVSPMSAAVLPPAVVPAALPSAAPTRSPLEPMVLSLGHDVSYGAAVAEIQALWGSHIGLQTTLLRTHMEQVRRFDYPVILEMFHPARRDTCYVALLRLSGGTAYLGYGGSSPVAVPLEEVDRLWTRQAVFLWHDAESLARIPNEARSTAWAMAELGRLGYGGRADGLPATVRRFQEDTEIQPDGIIGTRTIMAIYSRSERPRPRLTGGLS